MKEKKSLSPVPNKFPIIKTNSKNLSCLEAIRAIINGFKVRRIEWGDDNEFCVLKDNFMMIHRNNKFHTWIVSEGDLMAIDWIIIK